MCDELDQPVLPAKPKACAHCPWRLANQAKVGHADPHKFYSKSNLARLWKQLRNGELMTCHPTDPRMGEFEHAPKVKPDGTTHECTGALILQQRELMRYQEATDPGGTGSYPTRAPWMSRRGLLRIAERAMFGHTFLDREMSRPNLNDADVGYPPLGDWKEQPDNTA